ncbi:MAG: hypothetical protein J6E31_01990, partial [Pyramidobacter sp.]|nr:hypothetical protein [Pyramidobacter sp.]
MIIRHQLKACLSDTITLLMFLTCIAALLTWILPAGEYDTVVIDGTKQVIAGSYHYIEGTPQGVGKIFMAPILGFVRQSSLITAICFTGAAIYMLEDNGALEIVFTLFIKNRNGLKSAYHIVFWVMLIMT